MKKNQRSIVSHSWDMSCPVLGACPVFGAFPLYCVAEEGLRLKHVQLDVYLVKGENALWGNLMSNLATLCTYHPEQILDLKLISEQWLSHKSKKRFVGQPDDRSGDTSGDNAYRPEQTKTKQTHWPRASLNASFTATLDACNSFERLPRVSSLRAPEYDICNTFRIN